MSADVIRDVRGRQKGKIAEESLRLYRMLSGCAVKSRMTVIGRNPMERYSNVFPDLFLNGEDFLVGAGRHFFCHFPLLLE